MRTEKSLRDVAAAIEQASNALDEILRRSLYDNPPKLSFEQKVIAAVRGMENGDPLKDFLAFDEIEKAISTLADIYTVTGVVMPEENASRKDSK